MKNLDEFRVKNTELGFSITIIYDRWGGMKVIKENTTDYGTKRYTEVYFTRDAMFDLANRLLKSECSQT